MGNDAIEKKLKASKAAARRLAKQNAGMRHALAEQKQRQDKLEAQQAGIKEKEVKRRSAMHTMTKRQKKIVSRYQGLDISRKLKEIREKMAKHITDYGMAINGKSLAKVSKKRL